VKRLPVCPPLLELQCKDLACPVMSISKKVFEDDTRHARLRARVRKVKFLDKRSASAMASLTQIPQTVDRTVHHT
jgi:hypothetical protein